MKTKNQSPTLTFPLSAVSFVLNFFDCIRILILKTSMRFSVFRRIFMTRSQRLFLFFIASVFFHLFIALKFPLWILLIGPLVLGVPHVLSSIRYVPKLAGINREFLSNKLYSSIGSFFVLMAALRIWTANQNLPVIHRYPNAMEMIGCVLAVGLIGLLSKHGKKRIMVAASVLFVLFFVSFKYPLETIGGLVLIHNFVGFLFWIKRAKSKRDSLSAVVSLAIFSAITVLILVGAFDVFMSERATGIFGGTLNELSIGSLIFPNSSFSIWSRAVSAYAFGQGVHYFVWLKAIPEQELPYEHPVSFSQSARLLIADMGVKLVLTGGVLAVGLILFAIFKSFPEARLLYLGSSAFHGYFEIAGLAFTRKNLS